MASRNSCVHYWKIEPPTEIESDGVCVRCGLSRTFSNASPERNDTASWKPRAK